MRVHISENSSPGTVPYEGLEEGDFGYWLVLREKASLKRAPDCNGLQRFANPSAFRYVLPSTRMVKPCE